MAKVPPTKDERDTNLQNLKQAMAQYYEEESNRLDNETKFLRAVLQGRGVSETGSVNLQEASALVQVEIDAYIGFE